LIKTSQNQTKPAKTKTQKSKKNSLNRAKKLKKIHQANTTLDEVPFEEPVSEKVTFNSPANRIIPITPNNTGRKISQQGKRKSRKGLDKRKKLRISELV